jgi:hypothetical protein
VGVAGVALFPALDDSVKTRKGDESYVKGPRPSLLLVR